MKDATKEAGFLSFLYPLSEADKLRERLRSVDCIPSCIPYFPNVPTVSSKAFLMNLSQSRGSLQDAPALRRCFPIAAFGGRAAYQIG
jgi:hypothetical protein